MEAKEMKKKFKEVRKETKKPSPYMTWNNKNFGEGTMSQGIFDKDIERAKDSARSLVMFLKSNQDVTVGGKEDKDGNAIEGPSDKLDGYVKELMGYVFDDKMIDELLNVKGNGGKKANDIVVTRLKEMGVRIH